MNYQNTKKKVVLSLNRFIIGADNYKLFCELVRNEADNSSMLVLRHHLSSINTTCNAAFN